MFSLCRNQLSQRQSLTERVQRFVLPPTLPKVSAAPATRTKSTVLGLATAVTLLLIAGCTGDETPKSSLFEHDHFVAEHWPSGLEDLSDKMRRRIEAARRGETEFHSPEDDDHDQLHHDDDHGHHGDDHEHEHSEVPLRDQIVDLVGWVGEVAADTHLSEADWIPLYEQSESLLASLKSSSGKLGEDHFRELESLCDLIDASIQKIPDEMPSFYATDP